MTGDCSMRHPAIPQGILKSGPTAVEKKQDTTTKAARLIIDGEVAARKRKTERLRLARLAKEATGDAAPSTAKGTGGRKQA
jgi:hypothetical protein